MSEPIEQEHTFGIDLVTIAVAIHEYKTTNKTQQQCANDAGISMELFRYYYLNGFEDSSPA